MNLYDQHLHSHHSFDCETAPAENVRAALAAGLAGLTFTEHFDTHPDEWSTCRYDDAAYSETIAGLRQEFGQCIFIGKGIEVCYQPDRMDFILDFLAAHQFDVVLLSVHWAGGRQLGWREHWDGLDAETGTRLYLERVLEAAHHCGELRRRHDRPVFDILGHLDFVKRYTHRFFQTTCIHQYGELIDDILRACLAADLTPEINTSTLRQGLFEPMPGPDTVRRYAALGGRAMSLGSDAHRTDAVGAGLPDAADMLRHAGIFSTVVFRARQAHLVPIDY